MKDFKYLELTVTDDESGAKLKPTPAWLRKRENRWIQAAKKAATMLPESFFKAIGKTYWSFEINQRDWSTATPGLINLVPSTVPPNWMTWEPLSVNGYSQIEMMFVFLHELGHIFDPGNHDRSQFSSLYYRQYQGISWWNDDHLEMVSSVDCSEYSFELANELRVINGTFDYKGTTFKVESGKRFCRVEEFTFTEVPLGGYSTLYARKGGRLEHFAESFALYVMWPEYLKIYFPLDYKVIKDILGREYKSVYPMPSSIKSKLTVREYVFSR